MAKKTAIRCPHCGTEYLPGEIYLPDSFTGQPTQIIKDEKGEVLGFEGNDMNTTEIYTCDVCGQPFKVEAIVTFKTEKIIDDFGSEVVTTKIKN